MAAPGGKSLALMQQRLLSKQLNKTPESDEQKESPRQASAQPPSHPSVPQQSQTASANVQPQPQQQPTPQQEQAVAPTEKDGNVNTEIARQVRPANRGGKSSEQLIKYQAKVMRQSSPQEQPQQKAPSSNAPTANRGGKSAEQLKAFQTKVLSSPTEAGTAQPPSAESVRKPATTSPPKTPVATAATAKQEVLPVMPRPVRDSKGSSRPIASTETKPLVTPTISPPHKLPSTPPTIPPSAPEANLLAVGPDRAPLLGPKLKDILAKVDSTLFLNPQTEEQLLNLASRFVERVTRAACRLASHRGSSRLETQDVQLILKKQYNIIVPGAPQLPPPATKPSKLSTTLSAASMIESHKETSKPTLAGTKRGLDDNTPETNKKPATGALGHPVLGTSGGQK